MQPCDSHRGRRQVNVRSPQTGTPPGKVQPRISTAGEAGLSVFVVLALMANPATTAGDASLDEAIRQNRMGTLVVEAAPGTAVRVEQQRHEFWFGAALANQAFDGGMRPDTAEKYREVFLSNFNAAVTENALKWHMMEPEHGRIDHSVVDAILRWTHAQDIPLRGHNLFWGIPNRVQPWLKQLDDDALRNALKARAVDVAQRYRGQFAEYDLNNEMLHANYYAQRLGDGITGEMADWVLREDPGAVLFLNDYDILTGRRLDDYVSQIEQLRQLHVPIGGIGVQGHLHGDSFDPATLTAALDRLAAFHLPIRVTEFNFPGQHSRFYGKRGIHLSDEEEQAKAAAIRQYLTLCFAHPAVRGFLFWGFWEGANWIPASSLYRLDWSPTPAAEVYRDLVFHQWWTTWTGRADASGRCEIRAFFGTYKVTAGNRTIETTVGSSDGRRAISFSAQ